MIVIRPTESRYQRNHRNNRPAVQGYAVEFKSPRQGALAKNKIEAIRLANNNTREGAKFAERLMKALPELRTA